MRKFLSVLFLFLLASPIVAGATRSRYPNELPGFRFYRRYFHSMRPFVSDRTQVAQVFGPDSKIEIDGWTLWATFIGDGSTIGGHAWAHNIVGLLASVDLHPKQRVSMLDVKFPSTFRHGVGGVSEINVSCDIYTDSHGLQYWVYSDDSAVAKRGDLMKIVYGPGERLERKIVGSP